MSLPVRAPAKAPAPTSTPRSIGLLQRKCPCGGSSGVADRCDACRTERLTLQRRATTDAAPATVPPIVNDVLRSPGRPLDPTTRAFMESRFGHDFRDVRIHTDAKAAESARTLSAQAYTVGSDLAFGTGRYMPGTVEGRKLLAHELAHVIQQADAAGSHSMPPSNPAATGDALETEADHAAFRLAKGDSVSVANWTRFPAVQFQRDPVFSVCSPADLEPRDVGTHAHVQIQEQFIEWCRETRPGIGDCDFEKRIVGGAKSGATGRADMARRTEGAESGTVWELGEIKPISWLIRAENPNDRDAISQLQHYIAAVTARGETAVPLEEFLPSTPVGPFRGDPTLDLYALGTRLGIYYYWCESRRPEEDGRRTRKDVPVEQPFTVEQPIIIELAPELRDVRPFMEIELRRRVRPGPTDGDYVIVAPWPLFETLVVEPRERRLVERFRLHGPPQAQPLVATYRFDIRALLVYAGALAVGLGAAHGVAALLPLAGGGAAVGGGAVGGGAVLTAEEAAMWAAISRALYEAASSPAARELAKVAGVLLVIGIPEKSRGETPAFEFHPILAVPTNSIEPPGESRIGERVSYEGQTYFVLGRATARQQQLEAPKPRAR